MKQAILFLTLAFCLSLMLTTACATDNLTDIDDEIVTETVHQTFTPDPCGLENIMSEVEKVHTIMRAFDDASNLAARTPHSQLAGMIAPLQDIRRQAEDLNVPTCLYDLKTFQLIHMNMVIDTMMAFLGGADPEILSLGIEQARQLHEQYNVELAGLIGATYVPPATMSPGESADSLTQTVGLHPPFVTNVGELAINLRTSPDVNADSPGQLEIGASTVALGQTADGLWILVEIPGQPGVTAWLYAPLVEITGLELLEIVQSE